MRLRARCIAVYRQISRPISRAPPHFGRAGNQPPRNDLEMGSAESLPDSTAAIRIDIASRRSMAFLTFREVGFQNYQIIAAANKRYAAERIERAPTRSVMRRCEQEQFACR
jgi:hypothetical protein